MPEHVLSHSCNFPRMTRFNLIEASGSDGIFAPDIALGLGVSYKLVSTILDKLRKSNLVAAVADTKSKSVTYRFFVRKHFRQSFIVKDALMSTKDNTQVPARSKGETMRMRERSRGDEEEPPSLRRVNNAQGGEVKEMGRRNKKRNHLIKAKEGAEGEHDDDQKSGESEAGGSLEIASPMLKPRVKSIRGQQRFP